MRVATLWCLINLNKCSCMNYIITYMGIYVDMFLYACLQASKNVASIVYCIFKINAGSLLRPHL